MQLGKMKAIGYIDAAPEMPIRTLRLLDPWSSRTAPLMPGFPTHVYLQLGIGSGLGKVGSQVLINIVPPVEQSDRQATHQG